MLITNWLAMAHLLYSLSAESPTASNVPLSVNTSYCSTSLLSSKSSTCVHMHFDCL